MDNPHINEQLDRIEQIQERIRQVLVDETLDDLEGLVAELGSRIQTILKLVSSHGAKPADAPERLMQIATAQSDLEALAGSRLSKFSAELVKARQNSMLSTKYRIEPARVNATMATSTDIIG